MYGWQARPNLSNITLTFPKSAAGGQQCRNSHPNNFNDKLLLREKVASPPQAMPLCLQPPKLGLMSDVSRATLEGLTVSVNQTFSEDGFAES